TSPTPALTSIPEAPSTLVPTPRRRLPTAPPKAPSSHHRPVSLPASNPDRQRTQPSGTPATAEESPVPPPGPSPTSAPEIGGSPPPFPIYPQVVIQTSDKTVRAPLMEASPALATHPHVRPRALSPPPTCPLSASTPLPQRSKTRLSLRSTRETHEALQNPPTPQLSPILPTPFNKPSISSPSSPSILPQQATEKHSEPTSHHPTGGTLPPSQPVTRETGVQHQPSPQ
uniref:extensin-like n=1 Tax=Epinephelus lanceolatus TaxID=310571 RepID=UPI0014468713